METKKEVYNPTYSIIEEFSGHTRDFKQFLFEQGKQTDKTTLILTGWDNRNIKFMINTNMIKEEPKDEQKEFVDTKKIKEIIFNPKTIDVFGKQEEKKEQIFQRSFSTLNCAESFIEKCPMFYDKSKLWWVWSETEHYWEEIDEIDLLNDYLKISGDVEITGSKRRTEILNALKMVGRLKHPKEAKTKYIQFKDKVVNIEDGNIYDVENRFFFTNPIPWEIGKSKETPIMDKLFAEWVGEKYVPTMYEIIAYCCLRNYPIQVLFCFIGGGRNGKSQFQKVLQKFIGKNNTCSTELDLLLGNRFESFKLYKKLVCSLGETNFGILNNTSLLKKLTGGDLIGYEKKNKDPFDDYNYAKILINSNSLPSSEDTSEGFYRRWVIIDFPNQFKEGKDIIETIPTIEYNNLCNKVISILPELLERGNFTNQGTVDERKQRYLEASNPLPFFINECCDVQVETYVRFNELFNAYKRYLNIKKRRVVTRKEFTEALIMEGYDASRTTHEGDSTYWASGISLKSNLKDLMLKMSLMFDNTTSILRKESNSKVEHLLHNLHLNKEIIYQKCFKCDLSPCAKFNDQGKPICEFCLETEKQQDEKVS